VPREALAQPEGFVVRQLAAALTCLSVVLLSACSTPEPSPAPATEASVGSTTDVAETTATSTPDDAVQTTSPGVGEDPGVPELPDEATKDTEDGAEAFVQHYYGLINYLAAFPKAGVLEPLASSECGTCENFEDDAAEFEAEGKSYDGDTVRALEIRAFKAESGYRVEVMGESPSYNILNSADEVIARAEAAAEQNVVFIIRRKADSFEVRSIQLVQP